MDKEKSFKDENMEIENLIGNDKESSGGIIIIIVSFIPLFYV